MASRARIAAVAVTLTAAAWMLAVLPASPIGRLASLLNRTGAADHAPLRQLLRLYDIPEDSQVLVFSKTSLQRNRISETNPRAIYFNDRAAIGWVPGSPTLEVATFDGRQTGVGFFTVDVSSGRAEVTPKKDQCIQCHALPDSGGLPGLMMRSANVRPAPHRCFMEIDDSTPYAKRWGGWFVTGSRVPSGHAGQTQLPALERSYPERGSDVVALLVLGHEVAITNLIARLNRQLQMADADVVAGRPPDETAIRDRVDELADTMLFLNEEALPAPVTGASTFRQTFEARGVRDEHGHSLSTLDLQRHLFRVPCSFMIHAPIFRALPEPARQAVYARMSKILSALDDPRVQRRIAPADRDGIVHLLRETVSDLPAAFGEPARES